jgi:hypothetical protein
MPTELEPQLLADQAKRDVADALIFTAATAMSAKIDCRAALNAEIASLEADIIWAAGKNGHTDALAARTKRRAELDAEITALEGEIAAAKTKRIYDLATKDAEISELEAEIAASKTT